MHSLPDIPVTSSSFNNIRDKNAFSNYPARIKAFSIIFPASTFSPAKTADRFSAIFSASSKSLA